MSEIGVRELKLQASEILRRVREKKESFQITYRGRVVARIVPTVEAPNSDEFARVWTEIDELAEEIGASWPQEKTAAEVVAEQRR